MPDEFEIVNDDKELKEKLILLNDSKPELNIMSVFDLRYKKNYTLEQISIELNMVKDNVVKALNDIIELV